MGYFHRLKKGIKRPFFKNFSSVLGGGGGGEGKTGFQDLCSTGNEKTLKVKDLKSDSNFSSCL